MKKIVALFCALLMVLSSTAALADLSDYNVVTSAETHKVILDTETRMKEMMRKRRALQGK